MSHAPDIETDEQKRERFQSTNVVWMQQNGEISRIRLKIASDLAVAGLRGLTLINGGAIVALFTVLGQHSSTDLLGQLDRGLMFRSFSAFAAGLVFCLVAYLAGYWSQQVISVYEQEMVHHIYAVMTDRRPAEPKFVRSGNILLYAAVTLAALSLLSFITGSSFALNAVLPKVAATQKPPQNAAIQVNRSGTKRGGALQLPFVDRK
jgi:hypothetical protein